MRKPRVVYLTPDSWPSRRADRQKSARLKKLPPRAVRDVPSQRSHGIVCQGDHIVSLAVPILAPLPHVPVHVIEPPGVGLLLANRVRCIPRVGFVPGIITQLRFLVAKAILRRRPGPTGIFPLGLAGQHELASLPSGLRIQLAQKNLAMLPTDQSHGVLGPLDWLGLLPISASHCSCVTRCLPR